MSDPVVQEWVQEILEILRPKKQKSLTNYPTKAEKAKDSMGREYCFQRGRGKIPCPGTNKPETKQGRVGGLDKPSAPKPAAAPKGSKIGAPAAPVTQVGPPLARPDKTQPEQHVNPAIALVATEIAEMGEHPTPEQIRKLIEDLQRLNYADLLALKHQLRTQKLPAANPELVNKIINIASQEAGMDEPRKIVTSFVNPEDDKKYLIVHVPHKSEVGLAMENIGGAWTDDKQGYVLEAKMIDQVIDLLRHHGFNVKARKQG